MKKILILVLFILCCSGFVFAGEFEDTLKKAEQGDAEAQSNLGFMYDNGKRVPQNCKQAGHWYIKAAAQGDAKAQYNLGLMYLKDKGIPRDSSLAYVWFSLAAARENKNAIMLRDSVAKELTPQQLAKAQELAGLIQQMIDNKEAGAFLEPIFP